MLVAAPHSLETRLEKHPSIRNTPPHRTNRRERSRNREQDPDPRAARTPRVPCRWRLPSHHPCPGISAHRPEPPLAQRHLPDERQAGPSGLVRRHLEPLDQARAPGGHHVTTEPTPSGNHRTRDEPPPEPGRRLKCFPDHNQHHPVPPSTTHNSTHDSDLGVSPSGPRHRSPKPASGVQIPPPLLESRKIPRAPDQQPTKRRKQRHRANGQMAVGQPLPTHPGSPQGNADGGKLNSGYNKNRDTGPNIDHRERHVENASPRGKAHTHQPQPTDHSPTSRRTQAPTWVQPQRNPTRRHQPTTGPNGTHGTEPTCFAAPHHGDGTATGSTPHGTTKPHGTPTRPRRGHRQRNQCGAQQWRWPALLTIGRATTTTSARREAAIPPALGAGNREFESRRAD